MPPSTFSPLSILSSVGRNHPPLLKGRIISPSHFSIHRPPPPPLAVRPQVLMLGHQRAVQAQEPGQPGNKFLTAPCSKAPPSWHSSKPAISALPKGMSQGLEVRSPRLWPSMFLIPHSNRWCKWQPGALENMGTFCWRGTVRRPSPFR